MYQHFAKYELHNYSDTPFSNMFFEEAYFYFSVEYLQNHYT